MPIAIDTPAHDAGDGDHAQAKRMKLHFVDGIVELALGEDVAFFQLEEGGVLS